MAEGKMVHQLEHAVNCCNGRVGRELMLLAQEKPEVRDLIAPTGVEILRKGVEAGIRAKDDINCCNGRVGRNLMEEVVAALGTA